MWHALEAVLHRIETRGYIAVRSDRVHLTAVKWNIRPNANEMRTYRHTGDATVTGQMVTKWPMDRSSQGLEQSVWPTTDQDVSKYSPHRAECRREKEEAGTSLHRTPGCRRGSNHSRGHIFRSSPLAPGQAINKVSTLCTANDLQIMKRHLSGIEQRESIWLPHQTQSSASRWNMPSSHYRKCKVCCCTHTSNPFG